MQYNKFIYWKEQLWEQSWWLDGKEHYLGFLLSCWSCSWGRWRGRRHALCKRNCSSCELHSKLPVGSRPPPAQQRESLRIACFQFWVRGNSEAIEGKKLFEQDFGDYTILLCVEWDSDIGWTNLDQFELRLISSDSCIWSKLKMWEKQKCEMWKVNQIDTNRAPPCTLPVQSVCPELNRSLASTLY